MARQLTQCVKELKYSFKQKKVTFIKNTIHTYEKKNYFRS
jgi:hypothetical protein